VLAPAWVAMDRAAVMASVPAARRRWPLPACGEGVPASTTALYRRLLGER
jgi:hypothetical protein